MKKCNFNDNEFGHVEDRIICAECGLIFCANCAESAASEEQSLICPHCGRDWNDDNF